MIYSVDSKKSLDLLAADLEKAVQAHHFGVMGVHDLRQKLAEKNVTFGRECRVFEVCNPQQARKVLEGNMAISTALPCRIALYEEGPTRRLATIKPTALIDLFASPDLRTVAEEVEATLIAIMNQAAA